MTASLIVAGYELYDRTVDPQFQMAGLGWNSGDPAPDQATIEQVVLDGEAVTGDRTRNRSISIPLWVTGNTALDFAAQVNNLRQLLDADTFTIQWTPDGGLPVVFDCFRATVTRPKNIYLQQQNVSALLIECQAKPFGRSPVAQSIAAPSSVQIDSYDTAPTGAALSTTNKLEGTGSAIVTSGVAISRSFAAKDLSASSFVTLWQEVSKSGVGSQTAALASTLTLTSASGSTKYTGNLLIFAVGRPWSIVSIPLSGGVVTAGSGATLSAVTSYSLTLTYSYSAAYGAIGTKTQYIDDLRGVGTSVTLIGPTTHAAVVAVPGVVGSARTPTNITLSAASTFASFLLHSPPIDQDGQAQILTALDHTLADQTITTSVLTSKFRGTYVLCIARDVIGGTTNPVTVTVTQFRAGGTSVGSVVLTKTYPSAGGGRVIPIGEVTLPLADTPADNSQTTYSIRVQTAGPDRFSDLMLLDTRGQTVYADTDFSGLTSNIYVDEPSPLQSSPTVYATVSDRTDAYGILGNCVVTGGPILLEPGTNKMLAWVNASAPTVTAIYYPRWLDERVS